ncbi:hypothetical protein ABIQ69_04110 [Agromyces sp. G08B096]|uniref:ABC transporter n=1 Tax=Agromyces sp. G08B096 TaxID=3156399 RepID=A0AAU7WBN2_9MICO
MTSTDGRDAGRDEPVDAGATPPEEHVEDTPVTDASTDESRLAAGEPAAGEPSGATRVTETESVVETDDGAVVQDTVVIESDPDADAQARLDAAVQRANAVDVASDDATPEPVPADSVRRETYVPPAAAGAGLGAATLAGEQPAYQAPQTVYVQAPTPPKARSNRGFGVLVALLGTVAFAALYAGVAYLLISYYGVGRGDGADAFVGFVMQPVYWVPVIAFFIGFAVLTVIVNRGGWWAYAVFGLLVAVFVYFSYIGAALLTVSAWTLTPEQAVDFVNQRWLDPFAVASFIIAREIPIWLGGWIAARGRTVTERNRLAMEAYDRELAAGPRPIR